MALFDLANSNAQVSAVTLASYGDEHWGKPRPQWPHGGIWWHIQPCVFPLLCYCFHWWTKRGQHQPNVDPRGPGGHLRKLSRLWNKNRQELYPLVWARLLDLESYKYPRYLRVFKKKQKITGRGVEDLISEDLIVWKPGWSRLLSKCGTCWVVRTQMGAPRVNLRASSLRRDSTPVP